MTCCVVLSSSSASRPNCANDSTASAPSATSTSVLGCALCSRVSSTANWARMETRQLPFPRHRRRLRRHRYHPPAPVVEAPLPGWRPHRLDNGDWGSIYLGDPAVLPSELVGATIVVQSRNGQSWTTTVTAVLDRGSRQVIVTDSGRLSEP